jgi:hypothetical protein
MEAHPSPAGNDLRLPLDAMKHIDSVCAQFEAAWAAGLSPHIEDYLAPAPEPMRLPLFRELLLAEQELRARRGESLAVDLLRARFPEYACVLDSIISEKSDLGGRGPGPLAH